MEIQIAREEALHAEALQKSITLQRRIADDERMGALSDEPPLLMNIAPSNPSTPSGDAQPTINPAPLDTPSEATITGPSASDSSVTDETLPRWMTDARKRFEKVFNAANQKSIVKLWLEFEKLLGYPEDRKMRLTNEMRPQQLSDWMQRHRLWDKAPQMDKASEFGAMWRGWWKVLQPDWRTPNDGDWPLVCDGPTSEGWPKLLKGGGNGFALVLLSLSWWMMREKDETRKTTESSSVFEDVEWVLHRMVQLLRNQREQALGGDQRKQSQGVQEQRDDGGEGEDDANTRPKKR